MHSVYGWHYNSAFMAGITIRIVNKVHTSNMLPPAAGERLLKYSVMSWSVGDLFPNTWKHVPAGKKWSGHGLIGRSVSSGPVCVCVCVWISRQHGRRIQCWWKVCAKRNFDINKTGWNWFLYPLHGCIKAAAGYIKCTTVPVSKDYVIGNINSFDVWYSFWVQRPQQMRVPTSPAPTKSHE